MGKVEELKAMMKARREEGEEEHSLPRKIVESELYDGKPTARFLLNQIAVMSMKDENANYPEDAPKYYPDGVTPWEKTGWCWLSQHTLALRVGLLSERQVIRLIDQFKEAGVVLTREWIDDHMTPHTEYKVVESVVDAFQRPSQKRGVDRPVRAKRDYKAYENKGGFKKGYDARRANMVGVGHELDA
jgi:hypothetical protein